MGSTDGQTAMSDLNDFDQWWQSLPPEMRLKLSYASAMMAWLARSREVKDLKKALRKKDENNCCKEK